MPDRKFFLKSMGLKMQPCLAVAFLIPCSVHASGSELDIGYGLGWDDNIFYSETQEESKAFGVLDLEYDYDRDLSDNFSVEIDVTYEDKHFKGESNARNRFFSGLTELKYEANGFALGGQIDPQYSQFVTSDTDGGLVLEGKQRIKTLKTRLFTEIDLGKNNSVEIGYEKKDKDYRDSDSDYDADIIDIRLRSRVNQNLSFSLGAEKEERDYDRRLAQTAAGADAAELLEIERKTVFVKGTWRVARHHKYSLEYRQRDNEDGFQEYYGHDRDQLVFRSQYRWENDVRLKTKIKLSEKSYTEQLADNGGRLENDKVGVDVELQVPMSLMFGSDCKDWYTRFTLEWDDYSSGQAEREYQKSSVWFTVHRVFN